MCMIILCCVTVLTIFILYLCVSYLWTHLTNRPSYCGIGSIWILIYAMQQCFVTSFRCVYHRATASNSLPCKQISLCQLLHSSDKITSWWHSQFWLANTANGFWVFCTLGKVKAPCCFLLSCAKVGNDVHRNDVIIVRVNKCLLRNSFRILYCKKYSTLTM